MYCSPLPGGDIGVGGGGFKAGSLDLVDFKDSPVPDPYPDPDPSVGVARPSTGEVRSSSSQESITSSFFVFDFIFDADGRSMCRFDIFDSISTAGIGSAPLTMTGSTKLGTLEMTTRDDGTVLCQGVRKPDQEVGASQETESWEAHCIDVIGLEKALHRVSETETSALRLVVPPAVLADPTRDVAAKNTRTS
jgi:hypothetical protein